jgi:hypothetical protein
MPTTATGTTSITTTTKIKWNYKGLVVLQKRHHYVRTEAALLIEVAMSLSHRQV